MAHELPRLRPRRRQAEAVDDVVEPALEQLQQRLAGDAARPLGRLEVAAELILEHAVDALDLLLLAQLQAVAGELRLPRLAVLPRREVALLDRALLRVAALALQEELHRLAAAQPADRTDITSHSIPFMNWDWDLDSVIAIDYQSDYQSHPISRRAAASAAGSRCAESASRRGSTSLRARPSAARGSPTRGRSPGPSPARRATACRPSWPRCRRSSAAWVAANGVPLRDPLKPMPPALDQATTLPSVSVIVTIGVVERRLDVRQPVVDDALLAALLERLLALAGAPSFFSGVAPSGAASVFAMSFCFA